MKFDNREQKELVAKLIDSAQITTAISNLVAATAEMQALVKAIADAAIETKPELVL